jgi:hypothetical protein
MSDALDELLTRPLPEPGDGGFSVRVYTRLLAKEERAAAWTTFGYAFAAAALLASIPFAPLGDAILHATPALLSSAPFAISLAVIVLTAVTCRFALRR